MVNTALQCFKAGFLCFKWYAGRKRKKRGKSLGFSLRVSLDIFPTEKVLPFEIGDWGIYTGQMGSKTLAPTVCCLLSRDWSRTWLPPLRSHITSPQLDDKAAANRRSYLGGFLRIMPYKITRVSCPLDSQGLLTLRAVYYHEVEPLSRIVGCHDLHTLKRLVLTPLVGFCQILGLTGVGTLVPKIRTSGSGCPRALVGPLYLEDSASSSGCPNHL